MYHFQNSENTVSRLSWDKPVSQDHLTV